MNFRGKTIKDLLVTPKENDPITKKWEIYRFKQNRFDCDEEYISVSLRTFEERFKEHLKTPFPINEHCNITGHITTVANLGIVGREDQNLIRNY